MGYSTLRSKIQKCIEDGSSNCILVDCNNKDENKIMTDNSFSHSGKCVELNSIRYYVYEITKHENTIQREYEIYEQFLKNANGSHAHPMNSGIGIHQHNMYGTSTPWLTNQQTTWLSKNGI